VQNTGFFKNNQSLKILFSLAAGGICKIGGPQRRLGLALPGAERQWYNIYIKFF